MRTGNHARKEKTDSKENAKTEEKHSTRKATGTWTEDMQMTSEEHTIWQRSAQKKKKMQKEKRKEKQQNDGKENIKE